MFRTLSIAAAAITMIAAPASAQSMRVTITGKSPEQLHADITKAAQRVCAQSAYGVATSNASCVKATVEDALSQLPAHQKVAMR